MQQNDKGGRNGRDEDRGDRADAATDGHTAATEGVLLRAGDDVERRNRRKAEKENGGQSPFSFSFCRAL